MDRLENEDIGLIWSRHFPRRAENASSKSLCLTLAIVVRLRARSGAERNQWETRLQQILADAGIPKAEFEELENESKTQ
jgi:hypothetical protein